MQIGLTEDSVPLSMGIGVCPHVPGESQLSPKCICNTHENKPRACKLFTSSLKANRGRVKSNNAGGSNGQYNEKPRWDDPDYAAVWLDEAILQSGVES